MSVRWDRFFSDLEAQAVALEHDELEMEVADRALVEHSSVVLMDRVRASLGLPLRCVLVDGQQWQGALLGFGADWLVLSHSGVDDRAAVLVRARALVAVSGLSGRAVPLQALGSVARRSTLTMALRRLMQLAEPVQVMRVHAVPLTGTVALVGRDYLDLACDDGTWSVPLDAVAGVAIR